MGQVTAVPADPTPRGASRGAADWRAGGGRERIQVCRVLPGPEE